MSNEEKIICKRTSTPIFQRNDILIRSSEAIERTCAFIRYAEDRRFAFVRYGDSDPVKVRASYLMTVEDWKAARTQQAGMVNYWTKGAQA